jgi:hypothetical protein
MDFILFTWFSIAMWLSVIIGIDWDSSAYSGTLVSEESEEHSMKKKINISLDGMSSIICLP